MKLSKNQGILLFSGKRQSPCLNFLVKSNFFYLSNLKLPNMVLFISKEKTTLFIKKPTDYDKTWNAYTLDKEDIKKEIKFPDIRYLLDLESFLKENLPKINCLYIDKYFSIEENNLYNLLKKDFPKINLQNADDFIKYFRMQKDKFEIENIKKAIKLTKLVLKEMQAHLKIVKKESQLEAIFYKILCENENKIPAFLPIIASSKNSWILHYGKNNDYIKDYVLFDLGARHNIYCADITRAYPIKKFSTFQKKVYQAVLEVNKEIIKQVKPGIKISSLNKSAKEMLSEKAKELGLIKKNEELEKYYMHSISHHLGLSAHDLAGNDLKLQEGNIITIEPGLYLEEKEFGFRIEDDILVTKNSYENLSLDIEKNLEDIENL